MNKKFWASFVVVYIVWEVLMFIVHEVLLKSTYASEAVMKIMRPETDIKMWLLFVVGLFFIFFFCLIFAKGREGKGLMEGVRYGFYVGMLVYVPAAYATYAIQPIPYGLALQWFIYGVIGCIIIGVVLAQIYGGKAAETKTETETEAASE
jgi:hypothetical protein